MKERMIRLDLKTPKSNDNISVHKVETKKATKLTIVRSEKEIGERGKRIQEIREVIEKASQTIEENGRVEQEIHQRLTELDEEERKEQEIVAEKNAREARNRDYFRAAEGQAREWQALGRESVGTERTTVTPVIETMKPVTALSEIDSLRRDLENTPKKNIFARRKLEQRIAKLEIDKKEIERGKQLAEDRERNPFKYFIIDKLNPKTFQVIFLKDRENVSVEDINDVMGETGRNFKDGLIKTAQYIIPERDHAVLFSVNGFYLKLVNSKKVRKHKDGEIMLNDAKAEYVIIGPEGEVENSSLDYEGGRNLLEKTAKQYQEQQTSLFDNHGEIN